MVVLVLAAGSQAVSASAPDGAPPLGGTAPPPASTIKPCGTYVTGKAAVVNTYSQTKETICGSQQADRITATAGAAYIETYGGVDYVNARNGKPDEIWNGSGLDDGLYDSCDRVYDLDKGQKSTARCSGVAATSKFRSLQATEYPVQLPSIGCEADSSGGRRVRFTREPVMRSVDATEEVDWQSVAWSALLYERVGQDWTLRGQTEWLWDRAYDEQVKAFPGNRWRSFAKNAHRIVSFLRRQPGMYRVAIHFKWYGGQGVPDREVTVWAGQLFRGLRNQAGAC